MDEQSPLHPSLLLDRAAGGVPNAGVRFGSVTLAERPFLDHVLVFAAGRDRELDEACARVLGVEAPRCPGTSASVDGGRLLWYSPNEWLLVQRRDPGRVARLASALPPGAGIVALGSAQTLVVIAGEGADEVLAAGCPLDLHPRAFPVGACAGTICGKAAVTLVAIAREPPRFELVIRRSFAPYLWHWLCTAAHGRLASAGEPPG